MTDSPISLSALLQDMADVPSVLDMRIHGLSVDSREVRPGDAFLALKGSHGDPWRYAEQAVRQGAIAVLLESDQPAPAREWRNALVVPVVDLAGLRGRLAQRYYQHPSRSLSVIGVTGTNGKTSVTRFLAQLLTAADIPTACIGTLGYGFPDHLSNATHTTPDAVVMQRLLASYRDQGAQAVVMEVSSHGLEQGRVDDVDFTGAVFTNLSQDHLDYHGTMDAYREAKALLFTRLEPGFSVINVDDDFGRSLSQRVPSESALWRYSVEGRAADLRVTDLSMSADGFQAHVDGAAGAMTLECGLVGTFNVANVVAAVSAALAMDVNPAAIERSVRELTAPPGRLERLSVEGQPLVVIDYAHTPAALRQVLEALRPHVEGSLWCVFGCGGDRDRGKRPQMGQIAEAHADHLVVTDDNPRNEAPSQIVQEILAGMTAPAQVKVVHDRRSAIERALRQAGQGDVVLIAGKGHETTQERRGEHLPFSDREVALAYLHKRGGES